MFHDRPRLPEWIRESYNALDPAFEEVESGLERTQAEELLLDAAAGPDTPTECAYALDRLLNRGWLYEVDGELRQTE